MDLLMGIDVGTSGIKIVLIDRAGTIVASRTREYPLYTPKPGWAEQNPADWWNAARQGVTALLSENSTFKKSVRAVGLTGQMHGAVFLDAGNRVVCPALLWCDQRTFRECGEITRRVGPKRVLAITGNPVLTGFQAPKILWLRNNHPAAFRTVRKILLPKDYLRFLLTGDFAGDVSDASGTSLFDVRKRVWSDEILETLNIPRALLPVPFESPVITGRISRAAARETGLPEGTPVVAGAGDQAAGGIANGIVEPGLVSVSIGTSGVVFACADRPTTDPKGRLHTFCHAVPGKWHLMGVTLSAGGSFRWFRDTLCREEQKEAKRQKKDPYEILTGEAAKIPPGSDDLFFLPYLTGERCPYPDPFARGVFFGLSLGHTKAHMTRALMEGVTFSLKDCMDIMEEIGLPLGKTFRTSGGGARSDFWCRLQADVFNRTVARVSSGGDPSFGAAIIAGAGVEIFPDIPAACRTLIHNRDQFTPDRKHAMIYGSIHPLYRKLYGDLRTTFALVAAATAARRTAKDRHSTDSEEEPHGRNAVADGHRQTKRIHRHRQDEGRHGRHPRQRKNT